MTTSTDRTIDRLDRGATDPAEGRPDLGGPGADRETPPEPGKPPTQEAPGAPGDDLAARLGERIQNGLGGGLAADEPDLLPNVEPSDASM